MKKEFTLPNYLLKNSIAIHHNLKKKKRIKKEKIKKSVIN